MNKSKTALFSALLIPFLISCSQTAIPKKDKKEQPIVARVGGYPIYLDELRANYSVDESKKDEITTEELTEFLPLFADYKAKVLEAESAGYFDRADVVKDLTDYEIQFAFPYWMKAELEDKLLTEMIERDSVLIKASHVLIELPATAMFDDTLTTYNRLMKARNEFKKGVSMSDLNARYSSKRSGRSMGGELGWIGPGWAVKPFEDATWNTEVGELSMPFRTKFGYHIVYVHERKQKPVPKKFSHIFFETGNDNAAIENALQKADSVFKMLENGASWNETVKTYSEDSRSVAQNGDIGWVDYERNLRSEFIDSVITMNEIGRVRPPFFSSYGVQIVRLDSIMSPLSDEEAKKAMLKKLKRSDRLSNEKEIVFAQTLKNGAYKQNGQAFKLLENKLKENGFMADSLSLTSDELNSNLLSSRFSNRSLKDFVEFLISKSEGKSVRREYEKFFIDFDDAFKNEITVELTKQKFPDFAKKSKTYLEGLSIYAITEDSVWNYAKQDSSTLRMLYRKNPNKYSVDSAFVYARVSMRYDSLLKVHHKMYLNNEISLDSLRKKPGFAVENGSVFTKDEEPFTYLKGLSVGEVSDVFVFRGRSNFITLLEIQPPRNLTFDEAYHRVLSEFQKEREEKWIERLRKKYGVTLYSENIPSMVQ